MGWDEVDALENGAHFFMNHVRNYFTIAPSRGDHYPAARITPLALLMSLLVTAGDPQQLLVDRAVETVIGALVGVAVVVLIPDRSAAAPANRPRLA